MDLFFVLLILLVVTRTFGELAVRIGQPALVGELISGVVLGTVVAQYTEVLPALVGLSSNSVFNAITDLGMFFIMLFAGIEMQPHKILQYSKKSVAVAIGGMLIPMMMGLTLGFLFLPASDLLEIQALFIGTALAITAVPATIKILIDLGKLNTTSGQIIVSAAIFDDIASLLLPALLTALINIGGELQFVDLAILGLKVLLFFVITFVFGLMVFPYAGKLLKRVKEKELDFSTMLIAALAYAVLAEMLELHFILGAFVAGLFFGRKTVDVATYESVRNKVSGVTFGFLAPIFFASIGLNMSPGAIVEIPWFLLALLIAAFSGKFVGAGYTAYLVGLSRIEATAVGVGMSARGAVELVIADIALEAGIFSLSGVDSPYLTHLFSAIVIMAIFTTLLTPVLLKQIYSREAALQHTIQ